MSFETNELSKIYHILCVWMFVNRQFIPYGAKVSHCCWQGCNMLRGVVDTPVAGFVLLFGSYFLLNISYTVEAGATLQYVQRY